MRIRKLILLMVVLFGSLHVKAQLETYHSLSQLKDNLQRGDTDSARADAQLELAKYYILKPGEDKKDLDSAKLLIGLAQSASNRSRFQKGICMSELLLSNVLRESGKNDEGKKHIEKSIELSKKYGIDSLLGFSYLEEKQYYRIEDSVGLKKTKDCLLAAREAFRKCKNAKQQAFCLTNHADITHYTRGDMLQALANAREALALYHSVAYTQLHTLHFLLATLYSVNEDHISSTKYSLLALRSAEERRDSSLEVCTIYNLLASSYYLLQEPTLSKKYYKKSWDIADKHKQTDYVVVVGCNYASLLLKLGEFHESKKFLLNILKNYPLDERPKHEKLFLFSSIINTHTKLKDFNGATRYVNELIRSVGTGPEDLTRYDNVVGYTNFISILIPYYIGTRDFRSAEILARSVETLAQKNKRYNDGAVFQIRYKLDSAMGNFAGAFAAYRRYDAINDSLQQRNKNKLLAVTAIEYETEKKDKEIQLNAQSISILQKTNELQQERIRTSSTQGKMALAGICLMLLIFGLLYNQYRIKQKANKQIAQKNQVLEKLVTEKEWLLKEVHHRVKNNLQTVMSLLDWQGSNLENDAQKAFQNSQNRVYAMSLIHQKLYLTENVTTIDMSVYLSELIRHLRESLDAGSAIRFETDIEQIDLDVSKAIPSGLIVNEAITNSIKYAFPHGEKGMISIALKYTGEDQVTLSVRDNGVGLSDDYNSKRYSSIGMRLMKGLSEDINGTFLIDGKQGTSISIIFSPVTPFFSKQLTTETSA